MLFLLSLSSGVLASDIGTQRTTSVGVGYFDGAHSWGDFTSNLYMVPAGLHVRHYFRERTVIQGNVGLGLQQDYGTVTTVGADIVQELHMLTSGVGRAMVGAGGGVSTYIGTVAATDVTFIDAVPSLVLALGYQFTPAPVEIKMEVQRSAFVPVNHSQEVSMQLGLHLTAGYYF